MKRNPLIRLAVTLLLAHGAAWAQPSPTELLAYVPADAEVVVGLDVQTLTANPAFDRLHHQLNTERFDAGVATIEQVTGINLLRDIERVVLLGELRNQGQGALILKGHWYEEDLIALVAMNPSYEEQEHGSYSIHVWTDENTGKVNHAVFLQPDVLAMSEWPAVLRRIPRSNLWVLGTRSKLLSLEGRPLMIDTDDPQLDADWSGLVQIIAGYDDRLWYQVASHA